MYTRGMVLNSQHLLDAEKKLSASERSLSAKEKPLYAEKDLLNAERKLLNAHKNLLDPDKNLLDEQQNLLDVEEYYDNIKIKHQNTTKLFHLESMINLNKAKYLNATAMKDKLAFFNEYRKNLYDYANIFNYRIFNRYDIKNNNVLQILKKLESHIEEENIKYSKHLKLIDLAQEHLDTVNSTWYISGDTTKDIAYKQHSKLVEQKKSFEQIKRNLLDLRKLLTNFVMIEVNEQILEYFTNLINTDNSSTTSHAYKYKKYKTKYLESM